MGQLTHALSEAAPPAPAGEYVPGQHGLQTLLELAPNAVEYVPAGQLRQAAAAESAPTAVEYLPAPHGMHVAPELAPVASEYVPAQQDWQSDAPEEDA